MKEPNIFKNILTEINKIKKNLKSVVTDEMQLKRLNGFFDDISRDVNRTFHNERFLKGDLEEELKRVLEALCYIKSEIGYCQGMNFVAGALICLTDSEEKAFWIFLTFLNKFEMVSLYTKVFFITIRTCQITL